MIGAQFLVPFDFDLSLRAYGGFSWPHSRPFILQMCEDSRPRLSSGWRPRFGVISTGARGTAEGGCPHVCLNHSLCWCVVSVTAADLHSLVGSQNINRPIPPVVSEICRTVGQRILTAQVILNLRKSVGDILRLKRSKRAPAGCVGNAFQYLVVPVRIARARIIRTDRINDDVSSERHFDGFLAGNVTLVVVAVADENDCPPHRVALRGLQQLFPAGIVECVVKSSRVARPQRSNAL